MKPKRIIMIRHAKSIGQVDYANYGIIPDHKIPLSEEGIREARNAGLRLAKLTSGGSIYMYVSPYYRTRSTAHYLGEAVGPQIQRIYEDPRIREQERGNFRKEPDSSAYEDERDQYGTFFYRFLGGESGADGYDRGSGFLDTVHRDFEKPDYPENAVIVTHGLMLRLLLMRWFHWSVEEFESYRNPHNCQFVVLELITTGPRAGKYQLVQGLRKREVHGAAAAPGMANETVTPVNCD